MLNPSTSPRWSFIPDRRRLRLRATLFGIGVLACIVGNSARCQDRPPSYESFVPVAPGESVPKAIAENSNLYLLPGVHLIDNPLLLSTDRVLRIHGADRVHTRLVPKHPDRPLIVIEKARLLDLTGLRLQGPEKSEATDFVALLALSDFKSDIELLDCVISDAGLVFRSPGSIRLQGTTLQPHGRIGSPIIIDDPDAQFTMVGGNISNGGSPARFAPDVSSHVWVKHGLFRIFGTGVQATHGLADFRIDSPTRDSPHVIANVRSEGNNGARRGATIPRLLYVPKSSFSVDVALIANSASWNQLGHGKGALVDYSAAGTVWLVGNNGSLGSGSLITGQTSGATVVALGNLSFTDDRLIARPAKNVYAAINLFYHRYKTGNPIPPHIRFVSDQISSEFHVPPIPRIDLPEPLRRPSVQSPLPGLVNVKAFGVAGDGVSDDTLKLQRALDAQCDGKDARRLYFPAGIYRLTQEIRFNHHAAGCQDHPSGGWFVGAGRDRTILVRDGPGGVFATEGLAYSTVQGMTFRSKGEGTEAVFSLENQPDIGHATQGVSFHDVRFEGGRYGLGIGLSSKTQCSENLLVDADFVGADYGLAVGSYNALANIVYEATFSNNRVAMGHPEETLSGGTWAGLGVKIRGSRSQDLTLRNSASGTWYFQRLDSDSAVALRTPVTGAAFPLVFVDSRVGSRAEMGGPLVDFAAAAGPIFLNSEMRHGRILVRGRLGAGFFIWDGQGVIDWSSVHVDGVNRKLMVGTKPAER